LLTKVISFLISAIIFSVALAVIGLLSQGFRKT
jgi:hypothetical protein